MSFPRPPAVPATAVWAALFASTFKGCCHGWAKHQSRAGVRAASSCFSLCAGFTITAQGHTLFVKQNVIYKTRSSRRLHPNSDRNLHLMEALDLCGQAFPVWLAVVFLQIGRCACLRVIQNAARSLQTAWPFLWDGELSDACTGIYTATSRIWTFTSN